MKDAPPVAVTVPTEKLPAGGVQSRSVRTKWAWLALVLFLLSAAVGISVGVTWKVTRDAFLNSKSALGTGSSTTSTDYGGHTCTLSVRVSSGALPPRSRPSHCAQPWHT
jgi:hypothetical protein